MDMHADMRAQRFRPRTIGAAEIGAAENENAAGTGHAPAPVQVLAGMVPEKGPERGLSATSQTSQQQIVPRADVVAARPAHEGAALPTLLLKQTKGAVQTSAATSPGRSKRQGMVSTRHFIRCLQ